MDFTVTAKIRGAGGTETHSVFPLRLSEVRELVQASSEGLRRVGVVLFDRLDLLDEDLKSVDEFSAVLELKLILLHVLNEHRFNCSTISVMMKRSEQKKSKI